MYQCVHNECDSVGTLTIDWTQWYWTLYQNLSWIRIIDQSQLRKKRLIELQIHFWKQKDIYNFKYKKRCLGFFPVFIKYEHFLQKF